MTTGLWMVFCSVLVVRMREGVVDRRWRTSDGDDGWFCWVSGVHVGGGVKSGAVVLLQMGSEIN
jgi:hypothetical protein